MLSIYLSFSRFISRFFLAFYFFILRISLCSHDLSPFFRKFSVLLFFFRSSLYLLLSNPMFYLLYWMQAFRVAFDKGNWLDESAWFEYSDIRFSSNKECSKSLDIFNWYIKNINIFRFPTIKPCWYHLASISPLFHSSIDLNISPRFFFNRTLPTRFKPVCEDFSLFLLFLV